MPHFQSPNLQYSSTPVSISPLLSAYLSGKLRHTMNTERISEMLSELLSQLGLAFSDIQITEDGSLLRIDIVSDIPSKIIGWHGETLNSLQHILKSMIRTQEKLEKSPSILIDVDGYRSQQEEKVLGIAKRKIDFVRKTGSRVALPPMSPYFRRVVHLYVANTPEYEDITTESSGKGEYRQIILLPKNGGPVVADGEEMTPVMAAASEDSSSDDWGNLDV